MFTSSKTLGRLALLIHPLPQPAPVRIINHFLPSPSCCRPSVFRAVLHGNEFLCPFWTVFHRPFTGYTMTWGAQLAKPNRKWPRHSRSYPARPWGSFIFGNGGRKGPGEWCVMGWGSYLDPGGDNAPHPYTLSLKKKKRKRELLTNI